MKRKLLIVCAFAGMGTLVNAQTTMVKNERGEVVTPEAGDWALGADATPILGYIGNMFNGTSNNTVGNAFTGTNNAIFGKYFKDENTAYRASFRLTTISNKVANLTDTSSTTTPSYITDETKTTGLGFYLSGGIEKRRGHGRLQGYYGAEIGLGFGGTPTVTNTWGNALSATNTGDRLLKNKTGATFTVGLRGFVGVEYFVLPKLSLGGEFGWGLKLSTTGEGSEDRETWNVVDSKIETYTKTTGKASSFGFGTDNFGGSFRIMYHF
ncbi:MAG: hypothetical protein WC044_14410 [Crocinitomicaceae bacterium]